MKQILISSLIFCLQLIFLEHSAADEKPWIYIDTKTLQLEVKQDNKSLLILKNIAIGRSGAGFKQRIGDDITPIGNYKIAWVNNKSPFYHFFGLNYPSVNNANQALSINLLSKQAHALIINAHDNKQIPPQHTKIGGNIGIHGLGKGDAYIHKMMNWTHGCIALTNEQIDRLEPWINKEMLVKIK